FVFIESRPLNEKETQLRHLLASLPNVKLVPNQPHMRDVFLATRLLLMPSRKAEGWGRTATEAQLCGIPVLGSNRGQLKSTIGPGGIALNPDAGISIWLRAFNTIWTDKAYYNLLSRRAMGHASRLLERKDLALKRFEECLLSAIRRERLTSKQLSVK